jgi:CheY-like chemotaxis protein
MGTIDLEVLVVDDDPAARELLATVLAERGARVQIAGSAAEARNELARRRPHIVISDLCMPSEDGCEMMRRIRDLEPPRGARLAAVAVTAQASREARAHALASGFDAVLAKPLDVDELLATVLQVAETAERLPAAGAAGSLVRDS